MGIDTTIYLNHKLRFSKNSNELLETIKEIWNEKIYIFKETEIKDDCKTKNPNSYKIYLNPNLIEFELKYGSKITISTDFYFTMNIRLFEKTICVKPTAIGRFATNMIVEFMDTPFGIYKNDSDNFYTCKKDWNTFKHFLDNITNEIGGNKQLFTNDGKLESIGDLAVKGMSINEMINYAKSIIKPCLNKQDFIEHHTWIRPDGVHNIKDDIWFLRVMDYK